MSQLIQFFWRKKPPQYQNAAVWMKVTNVVASAVLQEPVDLKAVVEAYPFAEYRPERFPGVVLRLQRPKSVILLFHTGKLVCTGATSVEQAQKAIHYIVQKLRSNQIINQPVTLITIQNVVATGSVGGKIDLEKAAFLLERTLYEPEQFPGLIYRMEIPQVVMLIYVTGRIVCVGAKKEQEIYDALQWLHQQLKQNELINTTN
jgi:transcription initiation factor TFIID TATA-box-binding protein